MERPVYKPVGTPVEQLDTPTLVVDLTLVERNLATLHDFFRARAVKVRPYVESHRCPAIAHKQLAAGGTVEGICVTSLGQAEIFAQHGFADLLITNKLVTPQKLRRLCALAHHATLTVSVDHPCHVQDLSDAATRHGVTLHAVVDLHTRANGCGVEPGQPAVDLARMIQQAPHLEFAGLMTREGPMPAEDPATLAPASRRCIQLVLDTRETLEKSGFEVQMVCVGGTYNYEIAGAMAGVTEILAGTYALMDARHAPSRPQFRPAAKVLATVTSRPEPGTAIIDVGQKAIGSDTGLPAVLDIPGATVVSLSAEHGRLRLQRESDGQVALGDKVWLTPWDLGTCVNLYDYLHVVRDERLEAVWDVAARGRYR